MYSWDLRILLIPTLFRTEHGRVSLATYAPPEYPPHTHTHTPGPKHPEADDDGVHDVAADDDMR